MNRILLRDGGSWRYSSGPRRRSAQHGLDDQFGAFGAEVLTENMLRTLEATLRAGQDDPAGGLHAPEGAHTEVWFQYAMASPVFAGVEGRLRRAEFLHQCGRGREAIGWLESIGWHSVWELSHRAKAARRAREICSSMEATRL